MPKLNRETWSKKLEKISQDKLFDCILSYAEEDKFFKKSWTYYSSVSIQKN